MYPAERPELIPPNQTFLLAEPLFGNPQESDSQRTIFKVPLGAERWVLKLGQKYSETEIIANLADEYLSLVHALKSHAVPFRIIIAHKDQMDQQLVLKILLQYQVRGLKLHPAVSSTCFPRDMMTDFDGRTYLNPEANCLLGDNTGITSPLGEGGMILKSGKKLFMADPEGFIRIKTQYSSDIRSLSHGFQFSFLPFPLALEVNMQTQTSSQFSNPHLDRAAALIKGKDGRDYLLADRMYVDSIHAPWGNYWPHIETACRKLRVSPIVVANSQDIPYSLNLVQFQDGSVVMTGGHEKVRNLVAEIVGEKKVKTTDIPLVFYPIFRQGGVRCLTLFAPQKIVGGPVMT